MNRSRHDKTELAITDKSDKSVRQLIRQNQKHEVKIGLPEMSPEMAIYELRRYFQKYAEHGDECSCSCCFGVEILASLVEGQK